MVSEPSFELMKNTHTQNGENGGGRSYTVSLIIPTLNEADNLPLVFAYIPFDWIDEVILVDGKSEDNTIDVARSLLPDIKIVLEKEPGKGAAMQAGYRAATGDILIVMDADGSNDPREIPRFIQALLEGADFVKGSRFAPMGGTTDMERLRQFGNWGFVKLTNFLFATQFTDLLYGYHAFWRYCLESIELTGVNGFEIDAYIYINAVRNKLRIIDVPSFEGYRFHGEGKLQTFPDGWRVLKTIMGEWFRSLRSNPEESHKGFRSVLPHARDRSILRMRWRQKRLEQQARLLMNSGGHMLPNVLQMLQHSILHLPEDASYQKMLPELMTLAMKGMKAEAASLMLFDEDGNLDRSFTVQNGRMKSINVRKVESAANYGLAGWIRHYRQPALVDDTLTDPRWLNRDWELRRGQSRSAFGIPVMDEHGVRAVVTMTRNQQPFTEAELPFAEDEMAPSEEEMHLEGISANGTDGQTA
jgi:glycosyltransferase involved in cell wall biosynthesis